jgi:ribosome-binding factor A
MPLRKPSRSRLRTLCAEVHPDDGSDPRLFFRKEGSSGKPHHKALQLCRQVRDVLDGVLDELAVVAVDPAPDSAHLLVTVAARTSDDPPDPASILASLDRGSGWLRSEVAAAITRKRAPILTFRVVEIRLIS